MKFALLMCLLFPSTAIAEIDEKMREQEARLILEGVEKPDCQPAEKIRGRAKTACFTCSGWSLKDGATIQQIHCLWELGRGEQRVVRLASLVDPGVGGVIRDVWVERIETYRFPTHHELIAVVRYLGGSAAVLNPSGFSIDYTSESLSSRGELIRLQSRQTGTSNELCRTEPILLSRKQQYWAVGAERKVLVSQRGIRRKFGFSRNGLWLGVARDLEGKPLAFEPSFARRSWRSLTQAFKCEFGKRNPWR